jgi:FlaA1/EpsC-like NDP-sugar epimerase
MTIPEACQLVLQAFAIGKGGDIFVLDMGEPIRILDLARNLILLSGLRPDTDIAIEFTGTRPGEKLTEELNGSDEDTRPTCHEKVKIFAGATAQWPLVRAQLDHLREACAGRNLQFLIQSLKTLVPEYNPSSEVLSRVPNTPAGAEESERAAAATV